MSPYYLPVPGLDAELMSVVRPNYFSWYTSNALTYSKKLAL